MKKLDNLQFLRFLAALIVIFAHVELYELRSDNVPGDFFGFGAIGVDIFFVISGFIMTHVSLKNRAAGTSDAMLFLAKRALRVMPLYVVFTFLMFALAWLYWAHPVAHNYSLGIYYGADKRDFGYLLRSLTFTTWNDARPLFDVGWTLTLEFWFYVLFTVCIATRCNIYFFFGAYAAAIFCNHFFGLPMYGLEKILLAPVMLEFSMGIFLYAIYHKTLAFNSRPGFVFSLAALGAFFSLCLYDPYFSKIPELSYWYRSLFWGTSAFFIVFFFLALEGIFTPRKMFIFFGDASYSTYLTHWICMTILPYVFWRLGWFPNGSFVIYVFISVMIGFASSIPVYIFVEKPLSRYLSSLLSEITKRRAAPSTIIES